MNDKTADLIDRIFQELTNRNMAIVYDHEFEELGNDNVNVLMSEIPLACRTSGLIDKDSCLNAWRSAKNGHTIFEIMPTDNTKVRAAWWNAKRISRYQVRNGT